MTPEEIADLLSRADEIEENRKQAFARNSKAIDVYQLRKRHLEEDAVLLIMEAEKSRTALELDKADKEWDSLSIAAALAGKRQGKWPVGTLLEKPKIVGTTWHKRIAGTEKGIFGVVEPHHCKQAPFRAGKSAVFLLKKDGTPGSRFDTFLPSWEPVKTEKP